MLSSMQLIKILASRGGRNPTSTGSGFGGSINKRGLAPAPFLFFHCQFRLKIPHCTGRKFPTPNLHRRASLASDGVEPSAVFWRVLGVTESEAKERAAASAPSCPRGGTKPALRRSFSR